MNRLRVLEYVRYFDGVWNLPASTLDTIRPRFPDVEIVSAADEVDVERRLPEADVVLGWAVRRDNFERASKLRWVHVTAAGVTPLMFPAMIESDVMISNSRGLQANAMAEHALGVMLMYVRKLHLARDVQAKREWAQTRIWTEPPPIGELGGSTLGLVGLGSIGVALATRAKALGMRVLAVRKHPASPPAPADAQWPAERLDDLLAESDVVVLVTALTGETRGLMNAARLARMKAGALLVNLGRGALVDEPALIAALERGTPAAAALDVTQKEPLPADSPLWAMPQVILTPHISGMAPRYWERAVAMFADHLDAFLAGRPLPNLVDKRAGY